MDKNFVLELASTSVADYAHGNGDESRDVSDSREAELERAIDAVRVLMAAEAFMRRAAYRGLFDFTDQTSSRILELYEQWLARAEATDGKLAAVSEGGSAPESLAAYEQLRDQVRAIVDRQKLADNVWQSAKLQLSSEPW